MAKINLLKIRKSIKDFWKIKKKRIDWHLEWKRLNKVSSRTIKKLNGEVEVLTKDYNALVKRYTNATAATKLSKEEAKLAGQMVTDLKIQVKELQEQLDK